MLGLGDPAWRRGKSARGRWSGAAWSWSSGSSNRLYANHMTVQVRSAAEARGVVLQVQVIGVRRVIVGAEHRAEPAAGRAPDRLQESRTAGSGEVQPFSTVIRRPSASTNPPTSTALAMACPDRRRRARDVAAGIGAACSRPGPARCPRICRAAGCRAEPHPGREALRQPAAHRAQIGDRHADVEQLHRARSPNSRRRIAGRAARGTARPPRSDRPRTCANSRVEGGGGPTRRSLAPAPARAPAPMPRSSPHSPASHRHSAIFVCALDAVQHFLTAADGPRGPNAARALCKERLHD